MRGILAWVLLPFSLSGFYVGNPGFPGIMTSGFFTAANPFFKFATGYLGDYTSNKRYVAQENDPNFDPNATFSEFGLHSQMASVSLVFFERVEAYGYAGGSKERAKWHKEPSMTDLAAIFFDFDSTYHFSWATGLRIIWLRWGQTFLGSDVSYFQVPSSHQSFFKFFNRLNLSLETEKQRFYLEEWQASIGLSSKLWILTPYAGVQYLKSRLHVNAGPDTPPVNYHNEKSIGYFFGLTISLTSQFLLSAERRITDEFAYSFSTLAVF
jgi:hypothetical protein